MWLNTGSSCLHKSETNNAIKLDFFSSFIVSYSDIAGIICLGYAIKNENPTLNLSLQLSFVTNSVTDLSLESFERSDVTNLDPNVSKLFSPLFIPITNG